MDRPKVGRIGFRVVVAKNATVGKYGLFVLMNDEVVATVEPRFETRVEAECKASEIVGLAICAIMGDKSLGVKKLTHVRRDLPEQRF